MSDVVVPPSVGCVMAHRGFDLSGLENSMRAFEAAVRLGVGALETDLRVTADGVLLAFHDARLDRVTDARGPVAALPWDVVRRARIGGVEPIPRLEDVLDTWPALWVNVDVKTATAVGPLAAVVRRTGARERVCVASFSETRRAAAVGLIGTDGPVAWSPGVRRLVAVTAAVRSGSPRAVRRALAGAACVQVPWRVGGRVLVTRRFVDAVRAGGAQVHVWTVDDPAVMRHLLDLGVDMLITNRSDLAVQVAAERSAGPPDGPH